jgi:peptidoglycan/xylan/chitin deacetylase (PgdA/CDA1 family)
VDAIGWLVRNPDRMRAMAEAGRQRVLEEWNYERQFAPVLERMIG